MPANSVTDFNDSEQMRVRKILRVKYNDEGKKTLSTKNKLTTNKINKTDQKKCVNFLRFVL